MFNEDDLLSISALQHVIFCPRQAALIHVEQVWAENVLTVEGQHLHERADEHRPETRGPVRIERALPLRSLKLGLIGRADIVEFHQNHDDTRRPRIVPVEYKRGRPKKDDSDRVQLCAQALCLEEMCDTHVTEGALFYGQKRRRTTIQFDAELRKTTTEAINQFRQIVDQNLTPPAIKSPKCKACSLIDLCLPNVTTSTRKASTFMTNQFAAHQKSECPDTDESDD